MVKELEFFQKIDMSALLRTSAHGTGLYFFIPADVAAVNQIIAGDRVEVKLLRHYKVARPIETTERKARKRR